MENEEKRKNGSTFLLFFGEDREKENLAKLCLQFIKDRVRTILNDISRASLFVIVILNLIVVVNNREAISSLFGISRKKYGDWLI